MSSCCPPEPPKSTNSTACCDSTPEAVAPSCCVPESKEPVVNSSCCDSSSTAKRKPDFLLWSTLVLVTIGYVLDLLLSGAITSLSSAMGELIAAIREIMDSMWFGLALGMLFVGLLGRIPREFVTALLGKADSFVGILRATFAGVLLDLCSHGILLVAMRLYQRGAGLGQVMAFLIASPWNSLSLTVILIALIGWQWTLLFIVCSMLIGIVSGLIFNWLVKSGLLPDNPNTIEVTDFQVWPEAKRGLKATSFDGTWWRTMLWEGIKDSRMIVRWLLLGVLLAAAIRTFVPMDIFQTYFGPTMLGLWMTIMVATVLEICSEGSTPIAADLVTRANAPGNGFAFLMTGVATDYTEVMALKETTGSWKVALMLPLITVPQVVALSVIMNLAG